MITKTGAQIRTGKKLGRISVELEVVNHVDVVDAQRGLLASDKVRRLTVRGVVDPGATRLVLPEKVVKQLGLPHAGEVKVTYANNESAIRQVAGDAEVRLLGRSGVHVAIVEPKRRTALVGAMVLEDLDFLVDCRLQKLVPRDPRWVISEVE